MRSLLSHLSRADPRAVDAGLLVLRLWTGLTLALAHGLGKVSDLPAFTAVVARKGFFLPGILGPTAALSELVGGLLLAIGLLTRVAATFVLVTLLVAGLVVHAADPFMKKELAFTYALSALVLLLAGPGRFSVDRRGQTTS